MRNYKRCTYCHRFSIRLEDEKEYYVCKTCAAERLEGLRRKSRVRQAWQLQLLKDFPFVEYIENGERTGKCISISCGNGWHQLIYDMCIEINSYLLQNSEPGIESFHIVDIREKYGSLTVCCYGIAPAGIYEILSKYEDRSEKVCEECGAAASLRESSGRWLKTLCEACANSGLYKISGFILAEDC